MYEKGPLPNYNNKQKLCLADVQNSYSISYLDGTSI